MGPKEEAVRRAQEYARLYDLELRNQLGFGMNGVVFRARRRTPDLSSHCMRP